MPKHILQGGPVQWGRISIIQHRNLPEKSLLPFIDYATASVEKVSAYLDVPPVYGMIIQLVGRHSRSMTMLAEKTIRISEQKLPNETCLLHELTHLFMGPSPMGEVFTEGLAVHVQAKLGGPQDKSFPTRGRSLDTFITSVGEEPTLLSNDTIEDKTTFRRTIHLETYKYIIFGIAFESIHNIAGGSIKHLYYRKN